MSVTIEKFGSNVKSQLEHNIGRCLTMLGFHAQRRVSEEAPFDHGHLRASINYQVDSNEKTVAVGTNITYGIYQEFGTRFQSGKAFIRPGIMNNVNEYEEIAKSVLPEGF